MARLDQQPCHLLLNRRSHQKVPLHSTQLGVHWWYSTPEETIADHRRMASFVLKLARGHNTAWVREAMCSDAKRIRNHLRAYPERIISGHPTRERRLIVKHAQGRLRRCRRDGGASFSSAAIRCTRRY